MTKFEKISLFLLRISLGWLFFYAGLVKILNSDWSAAGYLTHAKTFAGFYGWLASPAILPLINFVNEWGLALLGVSLILGLFVRLSSVLGAVLMLLYYLPANALPFVTNGYLVDEHIIFIFALLFFAATHAGRVWGLENWCANLPICAKFPKLRNLLG
ncbi:MAG: DoxX family protein [Patescibacteria group bacterium]|mgnify:CR=1 FL=1